MLRALQLVPVQQRLQQLEVQASRLHLLVLLPSVQRILQLQLSSNSSAPRGQGRQSKMLQLQLLKAQRRPPSLMLPLARHNSRSSLAGHAASTALRLNCAAAALIFCFLVRL